MALEDWRRRLGLNRKDLGAILEKSGESIRRYELPPGHPAKKIPDHDTVIVVCAVTGGEVEPNDFYDMATIRAAQAAAADAPDPAAAVRAARAVIAARAAEGRARLPLAAPRSAPPPVRPAGSPRLSASALVGDERVEPPAGRLDPATLDG